MDNLRKTMIANTFILLLYSLIGCAHVPGDAALRAGHSEQAAELYMKGTDQGDERAALKMGLLIHQGILKDSRYNTALYWFKRAAELGSVPGYHNVGVAYEYGEGVEKDLVQAKYYYEKAAKKGYMQSQYNLGSMYANSYITPADDVEGYKWMLLAKKAASKNPNDSLCEWILKDSPGHMKKLKDRMSETQIKKAENLAIKWKAEK